MQQDPSSDFFLPDFCERHMVLALVVLAELFAFILTLAQASYATNPWEDLALISLFMQWAALSGAAMLCVTRRQLQKLPPQRAISTAYMLLLLVIIVLSEATYLVLGRSGFMLHAGDHLEFMLRNVAIGGIVSALALRYFYMQQQWRQRLQAEAQARLDALHARIRPHFLFNSMNTIASLIATHPQQAEEAVEDLSDLFRASLGKESHFLPLSEELTLTRRYLHMEGLRLGARLDVVWQIEAGLDDVLLPPLTLQPLVENAVYHGIEPLSEGGTITIGVRREGGSLHLWVSNPAPPGAISEHNGNRLALQNIRERLAAHYEDGAGLELCREEGSVVVRLRLPLQRESEA